MHKERDYKYWNTTVARKQSKHALMKYIGFAVPASLCKATLPVPWGLVLIVGIFLSPFQIVACQFFDLDMMQQSRPSAVMAKAVLQTCLILLANYCDAKWGFSTWMSKSATDFFDIFFFSRKVFLTVNKFLKYSNVSFQGLWDASPFPPKQRHLHEALIMTDYYINIGKQRSAPEEITHNGL